MEDLEIFGIPYLAKGTGIHIKKENRGKFTETKKRTGKTTEELTHSKNPLTRKRASNLGGWTKNVTNSLTNGRYKNLQNVQNFGQFKQGLKQKNYNTRPAFYNVEMNRGRNRDKQIINQWNKQQGLNPIAQIYNQNINQV